MIPAFDAGISDYSATTTNATNAVTAVAEDENAKVVITLNNTTNVSNGTAATWVTGENKLEIRVENGEANKTYTVVVTKT